MTKHDSERSQRILSFINETIRARGFPPTVREIAKSVGLASTSAVHHHLRALENEGLLEREATQSRALKIVGPAEERAVSIPVIGEIAAGAPIQAYEDRSETLAVSEQMMGTSQTYVLRVRGKSMIEDLIDDGDYVIIQPQTVAHDGDIVVALLEDNNVTLKRFFKEKDRFRLQPANSEMAPIFVKDLTIQGKVIGVIRMVK